MVGQDFIVDEDRTGPSFATLFALNMLVLVGTEAGDTYAASEVRGWMQEAALRRVVRKDILFGAGLIIGRSSRDRFPVLPFPLAAHVVTLLGPAGET